MIAFFASAVIAVAAFLSLRLYPIWRQREQGCDAFNILLCAEAIRRDKRFPARIPDLFILEEAEQWYPPLFLVLCALLPQGWLKRRYWLFNQLIDLCNAALLFTLTAIYTASPWLACAAVLIYAICAGLVLEFAVLTTRPLGLLVVNLLIVTAALSVQDSFWLPVAIGCGILLLYSHKLSTQQVWLTLPILFATTGDWVWGALLPGMYAAGFLVWPRGLRALFNAHIAIVRFWGRNWPLLGAHAVHQSPLYGRTNGRRYDYYAAWSNGVPLKFLKEALHQNYFILPALAGLAEYLAPSVGAQDEGRALVPVLATWVASIYAMSALTHFVPKLRGLGLGMQYMKFALLPCLCLVAILLAHSPTLLTLGMATLALLLALRQYGLLLRNLRNESVSPAGGRSEALMQILELLRGDPLARIMVLPVHLCDLVAYMTRRPVYWGTHGQCFDNRLEQFFPVLRQRISYFVEDGALNRLLLDKRYATADELELSPADLIAESGPYQLYQLQAGRVDIASDQREDEDSIRS